ncbi:toxin glutamine deamidase domain-containing protein [Nonomuraea sp. NPDC047529]|uniref:toxin glutamine deamidase domain-containing protein n=1 Tax=Nonomuraea sp. NPDC047529 TaxID=3155623 RepID=UPI0033F62D2E
MATPEEAQLTLATIARLAEEHGNALDRTYQLFGDGALLGPGATRMHEGLIEQHLAVRHAFTRAFETVEQLAATGGKSPTIHAPQLRPPPAPLPTPPGGYVGGSPGLMEALDSEFGRVGSDWQEAGHELSGALSHIGLATSAGRTVTMAGSWLVDQRKDLQRRRAELLKAPAQPAMDGSRAVSGTAGGGPAPVLGMLVTLLNLREQDRSPVEEFSDKATSLLNKGIAWYGDFWAGNVERLSVKLGQPQIGKAARQYVDKVAAPFTQGANEATWGLLKGAWNWSQLGLITDPIGFLNRLRGAGETAAFAKQQPVEFGKALADLETLQKDPGRWFGRLVPDVILTIATAGVGSEVTAANRLRKGFDDGGRRRTSSTPGLPSKSPFQDPNITRHAGNAPQQEFDVLFTDIKDVNPQFSSQAWQYTNNCQSCVVVTDRLLSGSSPISAVPHHPSHPFDWPRSVTDTVGGGKPFRAVKDYDEIVTELLRGGDGARGIIHGMRVDPRTGLPRAGHVFNVVNRGGKVYFVDGQNGSWATPENFAHMEFLRTN